MTEETLTPIDYPQITAKNVSQFENFVIGADLSRLIQLTKDDSSTREMLSAELGILDLEDRRLKLKGESISESLFIAFNSRSEEVAKKLTDGVELHHKKLNEAEGKEIILLKDKLSSFYKNQ